MQRNALERGLRTVTAAGILFGLGACAIPTPQREGNGEGSQETTSVTEKAPEAVAVAAPKKEVRKDVKEYTHDQIPAGLEKQLEKQKIDAQKVIDIGLIDPNGVRVGFSFVEAGESNYVAFQSGDGNYAVDEYMTTAEVDQKTGQMFAVFRDKKIGAMFLQFGLDARITRKPGETDSDYMARIQDETMAAYKQSNKVVSVTVSNVLMYDNEKGYQKVQVAGADMIGSLLASLPHGIAYAEEMPRVAQVEGKVAATSTVTAESTATPKPTNQPEAAATPGGEVVSKGINLRSGPGTDYPMIGGLQYGDKFQVLGVTDNGWAEIMVNGQKVFVRADLVQLNEAVKTLPKLDPASLPTRMPTAVATSTQTPEPTIPSTKAIETQNNGEVANGVRTDVMQQIQIMYGSVDGMIGKTFIMNGARAGEVQNGGNPTFHSKVMWVRLTQELGWFHAPDGSKVNRRFKADAGGRTIEVDLMDAPKSNTQPRIDRTLMGGWGYNWNLFPGADGKPFAHIYNVAEIQPDLSLAKVAYSGQVIGVFTDDYPEDMVNGIATSYRAVYIDR